MKFGIFLLFIYVSSGFLVYGKKDTTNYSLLGYNIGFNKTISYDEIDDPKPFKGSVFQYVNMSYIEFTAKYILYMNHSSANLNLEPIISYKNYSTNYIEINQSFTSYNLCRLIKKQLKRNISYYAGIGFNSFKIDKKHYSKNEYNTMLNSVYNTNIFHKNTDINLRLCANHYLPNSKSNVLISLGIPVFSIVHRPDTYNPRRANYFKVNPKYAFFNKLYGFNSYINFFIPINKRFVWSFSYTSVFYKYDDVYMVKNYNQQLQTGIYFKFY